MSVYLSYQNNTIWNYEASDVKKQSALHFHVLNKVLQLKSDLFKKICDSNVS